MNPSARLSAAIEILTVTEEQHRPVTDVLKDWGKSHRFAGSKDRAAIADLAYDAFRVRGSSSWAMDAATPRAMLIGALHSLRGLPAGGIRALFNGEGHAPTPLAEAEEARLAVFDLAGAPDHIRGDYPEWLAPSFASTFGAAAVAEGQALARRAPVDLRVNGLKGARAKAEASLAHLKPVETPHSPWGLRLGRGSEDKMPAVQAEPAYLKGLVEIQDEGSQIAVLASGAAPGQQVLDLCAGGGGKTLALAAMMANKGQLYAADTDARRLAPIYDRLARANVRNVQVRGPRGETDVLADLEGRCDLVLVDAPCTGTGTWRRNPDAKWRLRPGALEQRCKTQDAVLADALRFVKPGGRLLYVTCSVLREENEDRIAAFLATHPDLLPVDAVTMVRETAPSLTDRASTIGPGLRLSPHTTGTDGFYIAALARLGG